jgi:acetyl-CoA acetyltransferase
VAEAARCGRWPATGTRGFEAPYGPLLPACFALVARRYVHETATTSEQLAHVAVTMREHTSSNPAAHTREPITVKTCSPSR